MNTHTAGRNKQQTKYELVKNLCILTIGGGVVFWATTFITSLLPIAAEYRAAFSNWSIQTVWVDSLIAGMITACFISYSVLRVVDKNPEKNPIQKSMMLSIIALVLATLLIDVPRSLFSPTDTWHYFLIGLMFNLVRFLFQSLAIGYLCKRIYASGRTLIVKRSNPKSIDSGSAIVMSNIGEKK